MCVDVGGVGVLGSVCLCVCACMRGGSPALGSGMRD